LENYLHSQNREKQDELREIAARLRNSEVLRDAVSSEMSAYERRCTALVSQVYSLSEFVVFNQPW